MKRLLTVTAVLELGAGAALALVPSKTVPLLVGSPLDTPAAVALERIAGAALLTLGAACWVAAGDAKSRAAHGLVAAMVIYNVGVAAVLTAAAINSPPTGVAQWPAVVLHAVMSAWCIARLVKAKPGVTGR